MQYRLRRINVKSLKVSEARGPWLGLSNSSEIWQESRQDCGRDTCQISMRYKQLNTRSPSRSYDKTFYAILNGCDIESFPMFVGLVWVIWYGYIWFLLFLLLTCSSWLFLLLHRQNIALRTTKLHCNSNFVWKPGWKNTLMCVCAYFCMRACIMFGFGNYGIYRLTSNIRRT